MFRSIRHGLFAALAGFTVLICVCYTGLALVVAYVTEDMLVDRLMAREAAAVSLQFRLRGVVDAPSSELIRVFLDANALPPPVRAQVLAGRRRAEVFADMGRHYHLRTLDLDIAAGQRRVYLLADVGPLLVVSKLVQDVGGVVIFVALALIGLALALAWLLSRRLVSPLLMLADEVRQLKPGDRIAFGARRRRDEIGYLADKLGVSLAELHAALAREHAFTRDVGHELRTPLTVMKNMLGAGGPLACGDVAQLRSSLDEVAGIVDVLFALARAEHIGNETLDLRACIEEVLLRLLDEGRCDATRLTLDLPARLEVSGNRHLCMLLLNNCLGNALFHGGPAARLSLTFENRVLSMVNTVDPAGSGSPQGFLHGQSLLRRVAAAMAWQVRFDAGAGTYRVDILPLDGC